MSRYGKICAIRNGNFAFLCVLLIFCNFTASGAASNFLQVQEPANYQIPDTIPGMKESVRVEIIDTGDLVQDRVGAEVIFPEWEGGSVTARVTWRSNWITPGIVEYRSGNGPVRKIPAPLSSRNHRVILEDLEPDTEYQFNVLNYAPDGEPVISEMQTFHTRLPDTPPPSVTREVAPLRIINRADDALNTWPVHGGVPFARGEVFSIGNIRLLDAEGTPHSSAWSVLSRWPDGSIRWALAEFRADAPASTEVAYQVEYGSDVTHQPQQNSPLQLLKNNDDEIRVDTGRLRFGVARDPFVAFSGVQLLGDDGTWQELKAGVLDLIAEDSGGESYYGAKGLRELEVEHHTSESLVIRAVGDHLSAEGEKLLEWTLRIIAYPESAHVRVFHTFGVNHFEPDCMKPSRHDHLNGCAEFRRLSLRLRSDAAGGAPLVLGGDEAISLQVPGSGVVRLFQHLDDAYNLEIPSGSPGFGRQSSGSQEEGHRSAGWVSVGEGDRTMTLVMRDFWEHYPKSIQVLDGIVEFDIAPRLASDQYDAFPELEHVLFAPFRDGLYRFRQGLEKRHEMVIHFGPFRDNLPETVRKPPVVSATPERFRDTEALGRIGLSDDLPPRFAAYTDSVRAALDKYLDAREQERLYGFMHFGDWYGEREYNWGNMEYDTPHGFLMEFASSGDPAFFLEGENAARHYMDIDVVHHHPDPRRVGLVWVHSMLHTGGYYDRDDPRFEPAYPAGHAENWGHMWGQGLADYYWLTGDPRPREVLLKIADMVASLFLDTRGHLQPNGGWVLARHPAWMGKILIYAYAVSGDEYYYNATRTLLRDYWVDYQTPKGAWDRGLRGGHCIHDPGHYGNAGFMVALLLSTLRQYHELTGDEKVGDAIVAGARWMIEDLWVPEDRGFRYTSCPGLTWGRPDLRRFEPISYAHKLEPDALFRDVILQLVGDNRLTRISSEGKSLSGHIRTTPNAFADLQYMTEGAYYALSGPGPHTVMFLREKEGDFAVRVRGWTDGNTEALIEGKVTLRDPNGDVIMQHSVSGTGKVEELFQAYEEEERILHAGVWGNVYELEIETGDPDVRWEVESNLHRELVRTGEQTEFGAGVTYPRYRFYAAPETRRFTLYVRSGQAGERNVTVLDPNGRKYITLRWQETGEGEWKRVDVDVPPFEPITAGFSYRGPLNHSDRQWSVLGDGAPFAMRLTGAGPHVSASPVAHFIPENPGVRARIETRIIDRSAVSPTVQLDGSRSRTQYGSITDYSWDMGDGTQLNGMQVEHTYRHGGPFEVVLTVTNDRGYSHMEMIAVEVPAITDVGRR